MLSARFQGIKYDDSHIYHRRGGIKIGVVLYEYESTNTHAGLHSFFQTMVMVDLALTHDSLLGLGFSYPCVSRRRARFKPQNKVVVLVLVFRNQRPLRNIPSPTNQQAKHHDFGRSPSLHWSHMKAWSPKSHNSNILISLPTCRPELGCSTTLTQLPTLTRSSILDSVTDSATYLLTQSLTRSPTPS